MLGSRVKTKQRGFDPKRNNIQRPVMTPDNRNYGHKDRIEERFLDTNDLFALRYREGLMFFEVDNRDVTKYKPYEQLGDIPPEGDLPNGFRQLEDGNNNDILEVDDDDDLVVKHVGIGIHTSFLRAQVRYPEGGQKLYEISNLGSPSINDPWGYVDGEDSPYDMPTKAFELWIPPEQSVSVNFFNPDSSESHQPVLNIKVAQYEVNPLDPRKGKNRGAIRKIVKPGTPVPVATVGTRDTPREFNREREWDVRPVRREKAQNIAMGGGRK